MKKTVCRILIISIIQLTFSTSYADSNTSFTMTMDTQNMHLVMVGGTLAAAAITLGIFSASFRSGIFGQKDTMYASLLRFDLNQDIYEMKIPDITADTDTIYMPLLQVTF